ncbi:MAG: AAA family ATPase [Prevotella sp.]|nr:AAA family ATPase [Prevotella sp.]
MTYINKKRLPVGIQSFKEIRTQQYLYIDKTDIIWNLTKGVK